MGGSRRLPWVLVTLLLMAVTALVVVLIMRDDEAVYPEATTRPSDTPSAGPTETAEVTAPPEDATAADAPADDTAAALPLTEPGEHLPPDGSSDVPALGEELVDGDYFARVTDADVDAMVLDADVEAFYFGDAAVDYLTEHDPTAEIPPPNGFVIVNDSTNVRTVPLAPDVRIWDWCSDAGGFLSFAERDLAEWAAAPAGGETACDAGAALSHGWNEVYWLQVRGGEVKHVIGQYLP